MRVLFLSHRIPYPPDKGDKIRSFRLLEALAQRHEVRLITHADDPRDLKHLPELCSSSAARRASTRRRASARLWRSAAALLRGRADLVRAVPRPPRRARGAAMRSRPSRPTSSSCSRRSRPSTCPRTLGVPVVVDLVDVDSEKWAAYAESRAGPMRWIYRREARLVRAFERTLAERGGADLASRPIARRPSSTRRSRRATSRRS